MPFPKWSVEPVLMTRGKLTPDKAETGNFCPAAQVAMVSCIRQLASLARIAECIFRELSTDLALVTERSEKVLKKIETCKDIIENLDARAVSVPLSDLATAAGLMRQRLPCSGPQPLPSTNLFLPSTRPPCVDALYVAAGASGPVPPLLPTVTPVMVARRRTLLDIETRKPAHFTLAGQEPLQCDVTSRAVSPPAGFYLKQNHESRDWERLPSPEEHAMLVSLEYPSTVVPVDTSGKGFNRMSLLRKSLIHADFVIKRSRRRSKRRHTICEGQELDRAMRDSSCQTEAAPLRSSKRRSRSVQIDARTPDDEKTSPTKGSKKSLLSSLLQMANVRMRGGRRADDGRSSSGNWSATSSTRASSSEQLNAACSRNSDSLISEATNDRSRDDIVPIQSLADSPIKRRRGNWFTGGRNVPVPLVRSPFAGRKGVSDDGDSSVYSVDTDGYYTSMHTDSGLWHNAIPGALPAQEVAPPGGEFRQRKASQSSVSTLGNSSINSFLSANDCSSNESSRNGTIKSKKELLQNGGGDSTLKAMQESSSPTDSASPPESEQDSLVDRIRAKTEITANRYPSMCAVSPESSDDDSLEVAKTVKVIVAEVHNVADKVDVPKEDVPLRITTPVHMPRSETPSRQCTITPINMYRSETPLPSHFGPIGSPIPLGSSTLKPNASSFSPEPLDKFRPISTSSPKPLLSTFSNETETDSKVSDYPMKIQSRYSRPGQQCTGAIPETKQSVHASLASHDRSLIPLKYAQRIIVTPISRADPTSPRKHMPPKLLSISDSPPSYISYKSPDSPVTVLPSSNSSVLSSPFNSRVSSPTHSLTSGLMSSNALNPITGGMSNQELGSPLSSLVSSPSKSVATSSRSVSPANVRISSPSNSLPRTGARVTLDPLGKIIYSSGSLERTKNNQTYNTLPMYNASNRNTASKDSNPEKCDFAIQPDLSINKSDVSTCPIVTRNGSLSDSAKTDFTFKSTDTYSGSPFLQTKHTKTDFPLQQTTANESDSIPKVPVDQTSEKNLNSIKGSRDFTFRPSRGGRFCRSYFPSHLITANKQSGQKENQMKTASPSTIFITEPSTNVIQNTKPTALMQRNQSFRMQNGTADNDTQQSGFVRSSPQYKSLDSAYRQPNYQKILQQTNCCLDNQQHPKQSLIHFTPLQSKQLDANGNSGEETQIEGKEYQPQIPPDLIPSGRSPPSTLDITSGAKNIIRKDNINEDTMNLKQLSATELFAIIHSSKRRHNIRSDSEVSLSPISSRSTSPAPSGVESGQLTRRTAESSPDRSRNSCTPRRKQETSMRDFKMLLLQTRTPTADSQKPSAHELLKVSPTNSSPRVSSPVHQPTPSKRRNRGPFLSPAYPPILEDCCEEEMESQMEASQSKATSTWV